MANDDFKFKIVKKIAVISEGANGWNTELNIVKFGDADPKIDVRTWSPDHTRMGKGISFTKEGFKDACKVFAKEWDTVLDYFKKDKIKKTKKK